MHHWYGLFIKCINIIEHSMQQVLSHHQMYHIKALVSHLFCTYTTISHHCNHIPLYIYSNYIVLMYTMDHMLVYFKSCLLYIHFYLCTYTYHCTLYTHILVLYCSHVHATIYYCLYIPCHWSFSTDNPRINQVKLRPQVLTVWKALDSDSNNHSQE